MPFGMTAEFMPVGGHINAVAPERPVQPNLPPQSNMQSLPVPARQAGPQFPMPAANPNAAFNRAESPANPNAVFNRQPGSEPPMMAGPRGQYADNPPGQRPAAVQSMVPGGNDEAMRSAARNWVHGVMVNNPEVFAELLRRRGLLPQGNSVAGPVAFPPNAAGPRPLPPVTNYPYNAPSLQNLAMPFGGG